MRLPLLILVASTARATRIRVVNKHHQSAHASRDAPAASRMERVAKFVAAGTGCDAAGFTYTGEEASWHVVHPHPMSSYVADWKDVVSTLRGTRFEKFLAMDGSSAG